MPIRPTKEQEIIGFQIERCPSPEIDTTQAMIKPRTAAKHHQQVTKSSRKRVRFCNTVQVQETFPLSDMRKHADDLWYTETEYRYMKAYSFILADHFASGVITSGESDRDTVRGLESYSPSGMKRRQQNKALGWGAVLLEQESQMEYGIYDDEAIAEVYRQQAAPCREEASERAWIDAMAVRKMILMEEIGDDEIGRSIGSSSLLRSDSTLSSSLSSSSSKRKQEGEKEKRRKQRRFPRLLPWRRSSPKSSKAQKK
uniref:Uncharacterized protein n=1 Tax=Cyclophora tenuis TaxID=216820 RepID=A0A7S1GLP4_CYCTE|mmetsp:Transcript_2633/g.4511  ORF Transcript_2633/g.4511 Transcript_2633/m.4511 type:complete len:256 (+) Transcript_2633:45-812(+)